MGASFDSKKGFTLVELLIVIVVIAILAAIMIVAYMGIQDRAAQSRMLSNIDAYEKALRMYHTEQSNYPVETAGPSSAQAGVSVIGQNAEATAYACLGNDFPASGIFRTGECFVSIVEVRNASATSVVRAGIVSATGVNASLSPKIITSLPSTLNKIQSATVTTNGQFNGESVTVKVTMATRGALYSPDSTDVAVIQYFTKGDQTCGRGQKSLLDWNAIVSDADTASVEGLVLNTTDPVWTQCLVKLQ